MKRFGYWWRESPSGNQHLISPTEDEDDIVAIPQDKMLSFKKLGFKEKGVPEHPRRCVFEVEPWLARTPAYQQFREAVFGKDYV